MLINQGQEKLFANVIDNNMDISMRAIMIKHKTLY